VVKVIATGGDAFLGGADFDAAVVAHLVQRFADRSGVDLRTNTVAMQRLLIAAEAAKIELSRSEEVRVRVPCVAAADEAFLDLEDSLSRVELERLTHRLVERTTQTCRDLLAQSKLDPHDIDELVFVGGMTRMPAIRRRLAELFPLNGESKLHPDLAVVVGAALLASGDKSLIDVASMSVGVTFPGTPGLELVPANTPVPTVRRLPLPRPPSDRTFVMGVYESVAATSLERDTLGIARVDAAWLTRHGGALTLEAWLAADSELSLFLDVEGGQKLSLELKEPPARTPAASPLSSPSSSPGRMMPSPSSPPAALRPVATGPAFRSLAVDGDAGLLQKMERHAQNASSVSGLKSTDDEASAPKPGDTLGGYLLLDVLGQGGMGTVYLAEHIRLGRRVALKMLRQRFASNPDAIERFLAEARAVNRIRHENIIEVTDLFETDDGRTCYIMELLEGRSVADLLKRVGPPRLERTLRIAGQVAQAMVAVHDAHIVHRDLKPENIYLTSRGGRDDVVKLLDFGVAKLTDPGAGSLHESQSGVTVGTLGYMAPEQVIGHAVDVRADIWSLGVCLYELVTGVLPYDADSERGILFAQLNGPPAPPGQRAPPALDVPAALDELVLQCLEREPSRRPQTMREVRGRLDAIAERLASAIPPVDDGPDPFARPDSAVVPAFLRLTDAEASGSVTVRPAAAASPVVAGVGTSQPRSSPSTPAPRAPSPTQASPSSSQASPSPAPPPTTMLPTMLPTTTLPTASAAPAPRGIVAAVVVLAVVALVLLAFVLRTRL
jgi:serine/threonine protein kinase